ncbi:MAG TPA: glycosyltransferase family 87 protein [Anaerolineales bacterium]|nr:glycosyltransferase family 87 protein [Anaerolineales bacterium]
MKNPSKTLPLLKIAALACLGLWAVASLGRAILQSFSPAGGNDLYTYWYAGHFLREGKDFYQAFIDNNLPAVPVRYLDRRVDSLSEVIFPGLVPAPASPPLAFYLMLPLAFFSWPVAKGIWLAVNLILLGCLPFLLVKALPRKDWLTRGELLALIFALLGLTSTRYAAASGQLTFLVLDLMLAALILSARKPIGKNRKASLWGDGTEWLAGFCLGLALSKYSLSIGLLILFVFFEPRPRLVLAALFVQLAGGIILILQTGTGPIDLLGEYSRMLSLHAGMEGIHLAGLFPRSGWAVWIGIGFTLLVGLPLAFWRWKAGPWRLDRSLPGLGRAVLAVSLTLWALLAVYHRAYDAMLVIVFFSLAAYLLKFPQDWQAGRQARIGLGAFSVFALLLLMIPSGSLVRGSLPALLENWWGVVENLTTTLAILACLVISILLLFRASRQSGG